MAITTTEYVNFTKKAFFDNREWLNQENWQMYFGGSLPSGVLVKGKLESSGVDYTSALARQVLSSSYIQFSAGAVLVNGIYASYNGGTSIPVIRSGDVDRLFVVRVFITGGNVKIVGKTKVAAEYGYTPTVFAKMLLQDESLACTRDSSYYEIPLAYEVFGGDVYDLRRLIYLAGQAPDVDITFNHDEVTNTNTVPGVLYGRDFVQTYGGMNYNVTFAQSDTATSFTIYMNPACSNKHTVVKLANDSAVAKQVRIPLVFKSLPFSYSWLESWDADPNFQYLYKELVAGDKMTFVFTPNGHDTAFEYTVTNKSSATGGGGIDPDDYFTKQEISAMMILKANVAYVDEELDKKEDSSALGNLAYQNTADYVSQVVNKPTLGALASKDTVGLASEVTGILPVANGGTGTDNIGIFVTELLGLFESKTFYVNSTSGSDTNDGSSQSPFATIQHAIDKCGILADSRIHIKGTFNENILIDATKHITFIATSDYTISGSIIVRGGYLEFEGYSNDSEQIVVTGNSIRLIQALDSGNIAVKAKVVFSSTNEQGYILYADSCSSIVSSNWGGNITLVGGYRAAAAYVNSKIWMDVTSGSVTVTDRDSSSSVTLY